jgi:hypothetical protein
LEVDATVHTEGMVRQAHPPLEIPRSSQERFEEEVANTFATADSLHEESMQFSDEDVANPEECKQDSPDPELGSKGGG